MRSAGIKPVLTPLKGNMAPAASDSSGTPVEPLPPTKPKSYTDLANRIIFTIIMTFVFLALVAFGAEAVIPLLIIILCMMFYEVTRINQHVRKDRKLSSVMLLKFWFLGTSVFTMTTYSIREPITATYPQLVRYYNGLGMLAFVFLMLGIVSFVLSLRKGMYRYQFIQFTWMVMALLFIVIQGGVQIKNMMRGMIWFLLPVSCVINNDIWAYIFGKLFGRTKLLALSPKKTLEGFIGAFFFTVVWAFWFAGFLGYFPVMYCPKTNFISPMECEADTLFVQRPFELPWIIQKLTSNYITSITCSKAQQHALVLAAFASLVAPFGGFFASGLKRAFKLKDFGDLIPGHGGITDRMDCQGMMGLFTWVYLNSYVYSDAACPSYRSLSHCAMLLSDERKLSLIKQLTDSLTKTGLSPL